MEKTVINCPFCEFTTNSEQGMKVHKKRKHTVQSFLKTCSLCDKTFKSYHKFRDHKFEHTSWNRSKNTYSCGLCDVEFENIEDLEVHLTTCEIYQCRYCTKKEKTVSEIKKHAKSFHTEGAIIDHLKISRVNKEQVCEKMY